MRRFQSPMGMHGFSKQRHHARPDQRGLGFNPRWGCMGFQSIASRQGRVHSQVGFNPRWGCMGFQRLDLDEVVHFRSFVSIPDGDAWVFKAVGSATAMTLAQFQSPMGMHGFSKGRPTHPGESHCAVSIPDGDAWVFKGVSGAEWQYQRRLVSIPDGDAWVFKAG